MNRLDSAKRAQVVAALVEGNFARFKVAPGGGTDRRPGARQAPEWLTAGGQPRDYAGRAPAGEIVGIEHGVEARETLQVPLFPAS